MTFTNNTYLPTSEERYGTDGPLREEEGEHSGLSLDLREVIAVVYRNRFLILSILGFAVIVSLVATVLMTRVYRSTATIQIEQQTAAILEGQNVEPTIPTTETERFLQTQSAILTSETLAAQVAEALHLLRNDSFILTMAGTPPQGMKGEALIEERKRKVISLLRANLEIEIPRASRAVLLTFSSPDRELSARVANSFAENYIRSNLNRRFDSSSYARDYLRSEISKTKERLENAERDQLAYAKAAGLIDSESDGKATSATLPAANLRDLNTAYARAQTERIEAEERWKSARSTPIMSLPAVIGNPTIQGLLQQRAAKSIELEQVRLRYGPDHPSVSQATLLIKNIDHEIYRQADNVRNSQRTEFETRKELEQALAGSVEAFRSRALDEQGRRVRYNFLKREVDANRQLYEELLQRYKQITAVAGVSNNNVSFIDRARTPSYPSSPSLMLNLAIALIGGAVVAAISIFLREILDDVVRNPAEVTAKLNLPVLGVIPLASKGSTPMEELEDSRSGITEAYHSVRTFIDFSTPKGAPHTLLLVSSQPSEGKSTSSIAIARDFAQLNRRVLLVDSDLRKPSLHMHLGLDSSVGFVNVLAGRDVFEKVVQETRIPGLDFLACGPLPLDPTGLLASSNFTQFLANAQRVYDMIVIDAPPVMGLADAQLLAHRVEAVAFVMETGRAHHGQAKAALRRLRAANARVIGIILTKFDSKHQGYGYNYGYEYGYGEPAAGQNSESELTGRA